MFGPTTIIGTLHQLVNNAVFPSSLFRGLLFQVLNPFMDKNIHNMSRLNYMIFRFKAYAELAKSIDMGICLQQRPNEGKSLVDELFMTLQISGFRATSVYALYDRQNFPSFLVSAN